MQKTILSTIAVFMLAAAHADDQGSGTNKDHVTTEKNKIQNDLDVIEVTDSINSDSSYKAVESSSATGLNLSLHDTPQSVSVVTQKQLKDRSISNLNQALLTTTGTNVVRDRSKVSFQARGFIIDNIGFDGINHSVMGRQGYTDQIDTQSSMDLEMFDKIEVVRGGSGLTASYSEPGGQINLVRKKPTKDYQYSGAISFNNWGTKRVTSDVSGSLDGEGTIRGRAIIALEKSKSFKDNVFGDKKVLFATAEADIGERGMLTVGLGMQQSTEVPDFIGVFLPCKTRPAPSRWITPKPCGDTPKLMGRNTYLGQKWSRTKTDAFNTFANYNHFFDNGWELNAGFDFKETTSDSRIGTFLNEVETWSGAASKGNFSQHMINPFRYEKDETQLGIKLNLKGEFVAFNNSHDFSIGYTYNDSKTNSSFKQIYLKTHTYYRTAWGREFIKENDVEFPIYGMTGNEIAEPDWDKFDDSGHVYYDYADPRLGKVMYKYNFNKYINTSKNHTLTASTRLNFDKLHFLLGASYVRYDYSSFKSEEVSGGERKSLRSDYEYNAEIKGNKILPYLAINYDITPNHTVYASYTSVFKPQENTDTTERNFVPPVEGANYEIGLKSSWFDERLSTSVALFKVKQKNKGIIRLSASKRFTTMMQPVDDIVSKGVDIEVAGKITDNWNIFMGYTYNTSDYSRGEDSESCVSFMPGFPPICTPVQAWDKNLDFSRHTPKHMLRLYTDYKIPNTKLSIGGGVRAQSETSSLQSIKQSGYALFDAHVRYDFSKNGHISVVGTNLTDKTYFENNKYRTRARNNFYGEPRTVNLTIGWDF